MEPPKKAVPFFWHTNGNVKIGLFLNETSLGFQKTPQNTSTILTYLNHNLILTLHFITFYKVLSFS